MNALPNLIRVGCRFGQLVIRGTSMSILNVRHTTLSRYRLPVRLGDHPLMRR